MYSVEKYAKIALLVKQSVADNANEEENMRREMCREMVEEVSRAHDCLTGKQIDALGNMLFGVYEYATNDYQGRLTSCGCRRRST